VGENASGRSYSPVSEMRLPLMRINLCKYLEKITVMYIIK